MTMSITGPKAALSTAIPAPTRSAPGIDTDRVADLIAQLLVELGEDPTRDGLTDTPAASRPGGRLSCPPTAPQWTPASPSPS